MAIDLEKLSPQQLDELIAAAGERKRRMARERIGDVRKKLIAIAKDEGFTIEELFGENRPRTSAAKGRTVPAKYRNPADPEQTWSGRGKRPRWFIDALDRGAAETELLIG